MKRAWSLILFLILVALVAISSAYLSRHFFVCCAPTPTDPHEWIHQQLEITDEQHLRLEEEERKYSDRKKHLNELIHLGNMEMGQAMLEDKNYSPRVIAAVEKIHQAQGDLQKVTLEHVFEMQNVLTKEQYEKLLGLTANALYSDPDRAK